jgi:glycosyltransferase involved in cell wall biosynthesis
VTPGRQGYHERVGIAYVAGWVAGPTSPNADGLRWFVSDVLALVRAAVPWVRVSVTGANPPEDLLRLADDNLHFTGHVPDLAGFYARARVVMAPIRFGAGVKVKTIQALQYGVPVVSTECGAEGIETSGLEPIAVADDAAGFAAALITLLTDQDEWERRRAEVLTLLDRWQNGAGSGSWTNVIGEVLERRERGGHAVFG